MIIIAESGSTKTDWRLIYTKDNIKQVYTQGINPVYRTKKEIKKIIKDLILPNIDDENLEDIEIYFFGAGCMEYERKDKVIKVFKKIFVSYKTIEVHSDVLAAGIACHGYNNGIAGILGTGANLCHCNEGKILSTRSGIGYILGDEGSGAHLGKQLIKDYFNQSMDIDIKNKFDIEFGLTKNEIIEKIYNNKDANLFLSDFSKFIGENVKKSNYLQNLVINCFDEVFETHIQFFDDYKNMDLAFVGSVAHVFSKYLEISANKFGTSVKKIVKQPIDELVNFYLSK